MGRFFATAKMKLPHINTVLAEMWGDYKLYVKGIMLNIFENNNPLPINKTYNIKADGGSSLYVIQTSNGIIIQDIDNTYKKTLSPTHIGDTITPKRI